MDHIITGLDLNILVITLGLITVGSLYLRLRSQAPAYLRQRIKDQGEVIGDLKSKLNSYRGKYQKLSQGVQLQHGTKPPESVEEATEMIPDVIDAFIPHIPKKWQGLAKNPQIRKVLSQIAGDAMKEYPKEATEFVAGFLPVAAKELSKIGSETNRTSEL